MGDVRPCRILSSSAPVLCSPPSTSRSRIRHKEDQLASTARAEASAEHEPEGAKEGEEEDGETPRGAPIEVPCVGGDATSPEENTDLLGFHP